MLRAAEQDPRIKHGMYKTRVYAAWTSMKSRCHQKKSRRHHDYGGRGIKVCERWRVSFESFFADMGHPPCGFSLDRINNNGNYEPQNCRWANQAQQMNNTRKSKRIVVNGQELTIEQVAGIFNIKSRTVRGRVKRGWPSHKIIMPSPAPQNSLKLLVEGEVLSLSSIARKYKISRTTLASRIKSGLTISRAIKMPKYARGFKKCTI